jgi:hypothetical protein
VRSVLWTDIPFFNSKWADLALERSKSAPLRIRFTSNHNFPINTILSGLRLLSRTSHLQLDTDMSGPSLGQIFDLVRQEGAHLLQELVITGIGRVLPIPRGVFGETPRLSILVLRNCSIISPATDHLFAATLTELHLALALPPWNCFADMLASLRCMPLLEQLFLRKETLVFSSTPTGDNSEDRAHMAQSGRVPLSKLSTLYLQGPAATVTSLFQCIAAPLDAGVHLHIFAKMGLETDSSEMYTSIPAALFSDVRQGPWSYQTASLTFIDCDGLATSALRCANPGHADGPSLPPRFAPPFPRSFSFSITSLAHDTHIHAIAMRCALAHAPLTLVRNVTIVDPPARLLAPRDLAALAHAETLELRGPSAVALARAGPAFTCLRALRIENAALAELDLRALMHGAPGARLVLARCAVSDAALAALRAEVGEGDVRVEGPVGRL